MRQVPTTILPQARLIAEPPAYPDRIRKIGQLGRCDRGIEAEGAVALSALLPVAGRLDVRQCGEGLKNIAVVDVRFGEL